MDKNILDRIWELSTESFDSDKAIDELKRLSLVLNWDLRKCIIIQNVRYNQCSDAQDYYSYYKIYDEKGKYMFALPFGRFQSLKLRESFFEELESIITEVPKETGKHFNGGDYFSGYRVHRLVHKKLEMYIVRYSWALFSEFEDQCSDEPKIMDTWQEVTELDNSNING